MNHLGGMVIAWEMLSGTVGAISMVESTGGALAECHPGSKRLDKIHS
jgi:hypothetical protein